MFKKLLFTVATLATTFTFAQENYDFSNLDISSKFTGAQATLSEDANGFILTPSGSSDFFELRTNGVTATDQNRVIVNYTNNTTTADGITFKASGTVLTATKVSFTSTSAEYVIDHASFTGDIQLRVRFTSSTGTMAASTSLTVTSLTVDDQGTLSNSIATKLNAKISASNGTISVEGANLDAVYSITGQPVSANGLANGVYIVKISKGNTSETVKVVMN